MPQRTMTDDQSHTEIPAEAPFDLFAQWFADAQKHELNDPNAVALATATPDAFPSVRMVLMKDYSPEGFVFYTNTHSRKGGELLANPRAALLFHWKSLRRQVRLRGPVEAVSEAESDAYYQSRPRDSRIGAWASQQSRPLESRFALEKSVAQYAAKYAIGDIPRPPYWRGFLVSPLAMEFWSDRPFRLHDRVRFSRDAVDAAWRKQRLYP